MELIPEFGIFATGISIGAGFLRACSILEKSRFLGNFRSAFACSVDILDSLTVLWGINGDNKDLSSKVVNNGGVICTSHVLELTKNCSGIAHLPNDSAVHEDATCVHGEDVEDFESTGLRSESFNVVGLDLKILQESVCGSEAVGQGNDFGGEDYLFLLVQSSVLQAIDESEDVGVTS